MDSTEQQLTWPWAGQPPEDERDLVRGSWPWALALALRRLGDPKTSALRYRVRKVDSEWEVGFTPARPRLGERPPHQVNEFGVDMDEIRVNKVVTFPDGEQGLVVRMDTQRLGHVDVYDQTGELSGEKAIFHAANVARVGKVWQ